MRAATVAIAIWTVGCSSDDKPSTPPAPAAPAGEKAVQSADPVAVEKSPILPESEQWSAEQALQKLPDEQAGLSAAVRLVHLAKAETLCVSDELSAAVARRLKLRRLNEHFWVLGVSMPGFERRLRAPVLLSAAGEVLTPLEGMEEELSVLRVSDDADVYPHLLLTPRRVLLVKEALEPALMVKLRDGLGFELRVEDEIPYVGVMWSGVAPTSLPADTQPANPPTERSRPVEVGRYAWEPYELTFVGPAANTLPDPPGGTFEIVLGASPLLIPMGGVIPEPDMREQQPPPRRPDDDDDDQDAQ